MACSKCVDMSRALSAANRRKREVESGCKAVLGLIQLISGRDDLTPELREVLNSNHRIAEAIAALAKAGDSLEAS